jgi:hypothetical protein
MNAFSTREIEYENSSFFQAATMQTPYVMAASTVHQPNYYNRQPISKIANSGPPVAFHNRVAKRGSAQLSIDSFYGGPTQPSEYET